MRRCSQCGYEHDGAGLSCPLCGQRLPIIWGVSDLALRRIGLAILVPVLVWIVMTRLLGV